MEQTKQKRDLWTKDRKRKSLSQVWLCDPVDYTVHGIFQARILYRPWDSPGHDTGVVASPFSRRSSQPRHQIQVSHIEGGSFTNWATREAWTKDKSVLLTKECVFQWVNPSQLRSKKKNWGEGILLLLAVHGGYFFLFFPCHFASLPLRKRSVLHHWRRTGGWGWTRWLWKFFLALRFRRWNQSQGSKGETSARIFMQTKSKQKRQWCH